MSSSVFGLLRSLLISRLREYLCFGFFFKGKITESFCPRPVGLNRCPAKAGIFYRLARRVIFLKHNLSAAADIQCITSAAKIFFFLKVAPRGVLMGACLQPPNPWSGRGPGGVFHGIVSTYKLFRQFVVVGSVKALVLVPPVVS